MKRARRWTVAIITIALFLAGAGMIWRSALLHREQEERQAINAWLHATILPTCEIRNQTFPEAIAYLNEKLAALPGSPAGLKIVTASDRETEAHFRPQVMPLPAPDPVPEAAMADQRHTLIYNGGSVGAALTAVAKTWQVQPCPASPRTIAFGRPKRPGTLSPAVRREYDWPVFLGETYRPENTGDSSVEIDIRPKLATIGFVFFEGDSVTFNLRTGLLRARTTEEQLGLIEIICPHCPEHSIRRRVTDWVKTFF